MVKEGLHPSVQIGQGWHSGHGSVTKSPPENLLTFYAQGSEKQLALDVMIQELLQKQAIQEIPETQVSFFSRVFLVPKKSGGWRMVIDLSSLNDYLQVTTFQMDTTQVIKDLLHPQMWGTSIDLSDAYLHVPMHPSSWKYLAFQVGHKRYQFTALPFGLSTAPYVFTVIMKVLKAWARKENMLAF